MEILPFEGTRILPQSPTWRVESLMSPCFLFSGLKWPGQEKKEKKIKSFTSTLRFWPTRKFKITYNQLPRYFRQEYTLHTHTYLPSIDSHRWRYLQADEHESRASLKRTHSQNLADPNWLSARFLAFWEWLNPKVIEKVDGNASPTVSINIRYMRLLRLLHSFLSGLPGWD